MYPRAREVRLCDHPHSGEEGPGAQQQPGEPAHLRGGGGAGDAVP